MPNALRDAFRVALKRFFWPPWERFPCCSSPQNSILCSRRSGMRVTWPAHRSWDCIRMVYMLDRPARARTSVSGIRSCHLMLRSFLRQVVWKWFSFLAWRWYTVHVSHAYSSVRSNPVYLQLRLQTHTHSVSLSPSRLRLGWWGWLNG